MQLLGIDEREGVLEVEAVDGVDIDTSLEAQQSGITLGIFISAVVFLDHLVDALGKDVVLDAVGKERHLGRDILRGDVKAKVSLPAVFRLQVGVTYLVAKGTLMNTVTTQFTHVGCTEASGHVQTQVQVLAGIPDGSYTTCDAVEVA